MATKIESISSSVEFDTSNFKANIAELNRQMRVLETGFRATAAGMDDWSKSATGLESRNKTLAQQIDVQKQKIEGLSKVYAELAADEKTSAKEKAEMQIKINKETEALGKLETELRGNQKALTEMDNGADKAGESIKKLGKKSNNTKGHLGGLKSVLKGVATTAAGVAAAVGGIAAGLATTIGPASDLEETTSKVSIVFGEQADAVLKFGESAAVSLGMSKNAALSAAGTYGNLFRAMGIGEGTSADMSTNLVKLAGDLASFNNMNPTEVLDKLRSGLSGETEPLKTLGINLNQATLEAQAMKMGLIDASGELTPAAKAQAAYALILEQTSLAQGDFARTSDGLANKQRILTATVDDIKASIGTGLLPVVLKLATKAGSYLEDFSKIVSDSGGDIGEMADGVGQLVSRIVGDVAKDGPKMMQAGLGILQGIITAIISNLPTMLPAVIQMIMALINFIVQNLPMLITAAVQIMTALANGIAQALPTLIPAIVEIIPTIITILLENLPLLLSAAAMLLIGLASGIGQSIPIILQAIPPLLNSLVVAIGQASYILINAAVGMVLALVTGIGKGAPEFIASAKKSIDSFISGAKSQLSKLNDVGVSIVSGVWKGISGQYNKFKSQVMDFFSGIVDAVKNKLDINSPSRVFAGIGSSMVEGLSLGFTKELSGFEAKLKYAAGNGFGAIGAFSGSSYNPIYRSDSTEFSNFGTVVFQGAAGQSLGEMIRAKRF